MSVPILPAHDSLVYGVSCTWQLLANYNVSPHFNEVQHLKKEMDRATRKKKSVWLAAVTVQVSQTNQGTQEQTTFGAQAMGGIELDADLVREWTRNDVQQFISGQAADTEAVWQVCVIQHLPLLRKK